MNYFRYKQFNKDVITVAVGYYLRYALSYRDISEILRERGVNVHHSTIYRWVQEYAPILYQIWKKKHKNLHGLMLETQDNNLIACKFYHNCGFKIGSVDTMLYANFEKAVFWYLRF